jgi:hypothetical protein
MTGSGELGEMKREMTGSCGLRLCRAVSCRAMFRFKAPFNGGERPVSN